MSCCFCTLPPTPADEDRDRLAGRGIRLVAGEVAGLDVHGDALHGVRLASGEAVARQALVVSPRFVANAGLLARLGLEPVDWSSATRCSASTCRVIRRAERRLYPGVYVAGNITDPMAQVIGAANAGLRAGATINADLAMAEAAAAMDRVPVVGEPFCPSVRRRSAGGWDHADDHLRHPAPRPGRGGPGHRVLPAGPSGPSWSSASPDPGTASCTPSSGSATSGSR